MPSIDTQPLQVQLEREWNTPGQNTEPIIIEEPAGTGDYMRLYTIWSQWSGLSHRQRSDVIMRAYQNTHTEEQLLNVTIAMGLTPDEAANMNLRYELE